MFRTLLCTHNWVKDCERILSRAEGLENVEYAPMGFFKKKYIVIYRCTKCSKLKKFVEEI